MEDAKAHEEAELLGFESRLGKETGTSIMIYDTAITINDCRSAIEKFWWPKLSEKDRKKRLRFELYQDGIEKQPPTPGKRKIY